MPETFERKDVNIPVTVFVTVLGAILTFLVVVGLQALFYRVERSELDRKAGEGVPAALRQMTTEQIETLGGYRWIDREAGIVSIPIERAMERIVEDARDTAGDAP